MDIGSFNPYLDPLMLFTTTKNAKHQYGGKPALNNPKIKLEN